MRTIHKFVLEPETEIETHLGAKFLSLQMQNGRPTAWFEVDTEKEISKFWILFVGTGHKIADDRMTYLSTLQFPNELVFHAYFMDLK